MSLSNYVGKFRDGDGGYVTGGGTQIQVSLATRTGNDSYKIGMLCHNATYIWLYRTRHGGNYPPFDAIAGAKDFINGLIKFGHPTRVTARNGPLDGDVLIFANPSSSLDALHSCVAIAGGSRIGGYNQAGWFTGGLQTDYTEHDTTNIDWVARSCGFTPRRAETTDGESYIWAVREATALGRI